MIKPIFQFPAIYLISQQTSTGENFLIYFGPSLCDKH